MTRRSIGFRLTVWYTAILSLALVLFSLAIWFGLRYLLYRDFQADLATRAQGLKQYLLLEDRDPAINLPLELEEYSQSMGQDCLLQIVDAAGHPIYANIAWKLFSSNRHNRRQYSIVSGLLPLREGEFTYRLGRSHAEVHRITRLLAVLLGAFVPVFIVCAGVGGYWLSRRALQPVEAITTRARLIGVHTLAERLPVPEADDELRSLTLAWNEMLARLETAVQKISDFTANASHELRTPVAVVRLAAETALRRRRSDAEYETTLQQIQRISEQMTGLLADLLFLARADGPVASSDRQFVVVEQLIENACADLAWMAADKQIEIGRMLSAPGLTVLGEPSALHRLLVILLENALKYTPRGGQVSVEASTNGQQVILRVSDSGIGIPHNLSTRVFERFFRVDESRNRSSGGHGLGLAIAQTIVQQHQGNIQLEPSALGGCTFSVYLG